MQTEKPRAAVTLQVPSLSGKMKCIDGRVLPSVTFIFQSADAHSALASGTPQGPDCATRHTIIPRVSSHRTPRRAVPPSPTLFSMPSCCDCPSGGLRPLLPGPRPPQSVPESVSLCRVCCFVCFQVHLSTCVYRPFTVPILIFFLLLLKEDPLTSHPFPCGLCVSSLGSESRGRLTLPRQ